MHVTYWARFPFGRAEITDALTRAPCTALVAETLDEVVRELPRTDLLVTTDPSLSDARRLSAALFESQGAVRHVHFLTAGRERLETAGIPRQLTISGPDGAMAPAVAEHAMMLALAVSRRLPGMIASRTWDRTSADDALSVEGGTMVVVGFGRIGRETARRARAFGMRVVAVSRTLKPDPLADECLTLDMLSAAVGDADVIVLCLALTPETQHIVDAKLLDSCKAGAVLVNVARGGLVDHDALLATIEAGRLAGAGLDVTDPEPLPDGHPLWGAPNVIITPHIAAIGSSASRRRLADGVLRCIQDFKG